MIEEQEDLIDVEEEEEKDGNVAEESDAEEDGSEWDEKPPSWNGSGHPWRYLIPFHVYMRVCSM